jgi:PAS domain S-box-containing protein
VVSYSVYSKVEQICFTALDISEQKTAEIRLRENEARFRSLVHNSSDLINIINDSGLIRYSSLSMRDILGYNPEDLLNKNINDFIHTEDRKLFKDYIQDCIDNRASFNYIEYRFRHSNDTWVVLETTCGNLKGDPNINGILLNSRDITLRKLQEENLRVLQRAIESTNNGIVITDPSQDDNPIIYVNKSFERITGYSYEEVFGKNCRLLNRQDESKEELDFIRAALKDEKECNIVIKNFKKDGSVFWNNLKIAPVYGSDNRLLNYIGEMEDITSKKVAETELIKTNFELDNFVYRASHDLRAPLRSILGLVELSCRETDTNERITYLNLVNKTVNKLDTFITDLINFSRNNRIDLNLEKIDLEHILNECFEHLKFMENASRLRKKVELKSKIPFYTDPLRMTIIIQNLCSNAIKYQNLSEENPFFRIKADITEDAAHIIFEDNGRGISEAHQEKIFEMFYRASVDSYGSGLGLYIVKQAVEKLDGTIQVDSKPGEGTRFILHIPNLVKLAGLESKTEKNIITK